MQKTGLDHKQDSKSIVISIVRIHLFKKKKTMQKNYMSLLDFSRPL